MIFNSDSKIYVAGHSGLVGSAVCRKLFASGYKNVLTATKKEVDLRNWEETFEFLNKNKPDVVVDAAAKVGGIYANDSLSGEFIRDNLRIQTNLIEGSRLCNIGRFIFLGSVCIYPKFAKVPVEEKSLLTGELEPTNEAYAIAKISGIYMLRAYAKQYNFKSVSLMPSNIYGPFDNFNPEFGHVIPALMSKMAVPKQKSITLWGDGTPKREFLYSEDLADAIMFVLTSNLDAGLFNVGSGENISIYELATLIAKITGFKGRILWDKNRPNGTPNRPLNSEKINSLGWKAKTPLKNGLELTWEWFERHRPDQKKKNP